MQLIKKVLITVRLISFLSYLGNVIIVVVIIIIDRSNVVSSYGWMGKR